MSNKHTPDAETERTWKMKDVTYRPPRKSVRIEDGDWERWLQLIANVPERESSYRDGALASFGVAVPCLISTVVTLPSITGLSSVVSILYFVVGLVALASGFLCISFDKKLEKIAGRRVEEILQDMKNVRERSIKTEETIEATAQLPIAG